jgi:hypothetical protein
MKAKAFIFLAFATASPFLHAGLISPGGTTGSGTLNLGGGLGGQIGPLPTPTPTPAPTPSPTPTPTPSPTPLPEKIQKIISNVKLINGVFYPLSSTN